MNHPSVLDWLFFPDWCGVMGQLLRHYTAGIASHVARGWRHKATGGYTDPWPSARYLCACGRKKIFEWFYACVQNLSLVHITSGLKKSHMLSRTILIMAVFKTCISFECLIQHFCLSFELTVCIIMEICLFYFLLSTYFLKCILLILWTIHPCICFLIKMSTTDFSLTI